MWSPKKKLINYIGGGDKLKRWISIIHMKANEQEFKKSRSLQNISQQTSTSEKKYTEFYCDTLANTITSFNILHRSENGIVNAFVVTNSTHFPKINNIKNVKKHRAIHERRFFLFFFILFGYDTTYMIQHTNWTVTLSTWNNVGF